MKRKTKEYLVCWSTSFSYLMVMKKYLNESEPWKYFKDYFDSTWFWFNMNFFPIIFQFWDINLKMSPNFFVFLCNRNYKKWKKFTIITLINWWIYIFYELENILCINYFFYVSTQNWVVIYVEHVLNNNLFDLKEIILLY